MAPRVRVGDYVWVDPDEHAADGRRSLRALDGRCPERTVDAGNETDFRGVVVFVGNTARARPPAPCFAHRQRRLPGIDQLAAAASVRGM